MTNSRAKGARYEVAVANYLKGHNIDARRNQAGGHDDRGDIAGWWFSRKPIIVECKNAQTPRPAQWEKQLRDEMQRAQTAYGLVAVKMGGQIGMSACLLSPALQQICGARVIDLRSLIEKLKQNDQ